MKKKPAKSKPKASIRQKAKGCRRPSSCSQFWVLDTGTAGMSSGTIAAHGPFHSQDRAEEWLKDISASDWLESCGCLRSGEPEAWGDEYHIVQVIRSVRPIPPSAVEMTLVDTANH